MCSSCWESGNKIESLENRYAGDAYTPEQRRIELAIKYIMKKQRRTDIVFDCGCGTGAALKRLNDALKPENIYASDFSDEMLEAASKKIKQYNIKNAKIIKWDITRPIEHAGMECADCITLFSVLPYVEEEEKFFRQLPRLLKKDGILIATYPNKLFDLFSLNSFTKIFILEEIVAPFVSSDLLEELYKKMEGILDNEPSFPEGSAYMRNTFFRRENPLEISQKLNRFGIEVDEIKFMHYHSVPPVIERIFDRKKVESVNRMIERDLDFTHWTQYFTNSTFMVCGKYTGI